MLLTEDVLAQYADGQIEIKCLGRGYCLRGEIERAMLDGDTLYVVFRWVALEHKDANTISWYPYPTRELKLKSSLFSFDEFKGGRICYYNPRNGETFVFFQRGDPDNLDPREVKASILSS